jgi:ech hydrogenase subunit F
MRLIGEALKNLFGRPFTQKYPEVKPLIPEGYRGLVEHDAKKCIYCGLCARNCPSAAIEVDAKKGVWKFDLGRCLHCAQCEETCRLVVRKNAIKMNLDFEHADRKKDRFMTVHKRVGKR